MFHSLKMASPSRGVSRRRRKKIVIPVGNFALNTLK